MELCDKTLEEFIKDLQNHKILFKNKPTNTSHGFAFRKYIVEETKML
jgi:hypothetical protein